MEKAKKPKSKARKIADWVITCVFGVLFVGILTVQIVSKQTAKNNYGVPCVGNMQTLVVLTDSMEPEYAVGSAIFSKKVTASEIAKDDDITFYYPEWQELMQTQYPIVTHRVRKINYELKTDGTIDTDTIVYVVGGINKDSDQAWEASGHKTRDCTYQEQNVPIKNVLGKVVGNSKFVGAMYSFATSIWGLLILLLVPSLYLVISFCVDIFKTVKESENGEVTTKEVKVVKSNNNTSNSNALSSLSEEEKKRLKEELLSEMIEEKRNENK